MSEHIAHNCFVFKMIPYLVGVNLATLIVYLVLLLYTMYLWPLLQCSATRHETINEKCVASLVVEEDHQKLRE